MSHVRKLINRELIHPEYFVGEHLEYECIVGSSAFGVSSDNSDMDIVGFFMPPKELAFYPPNFLRGYDEIAKPYEQYTEHHIKYNNAEYDITIYNIIKFIKMCKKSNPNSVDSLYVPENCITHMGKIGKIIRDNRKMFLTKECWRTFKEYAYSQLVKIKKKRNASNPKRKETIEKFGFDVKFAYHIIRLINESEQILLERDLDIQRTREQLKSIRRGEWSIEQIEEYFQRKSIDLETVYLNSKIPYEVNQVEVRGLLLSCLEHHYGSLEKASAVDRSNDLIRDMEKVLKRYKGSCDKNEEIDEVIEEDTNVFWDKRCLKKYRKTESFYSKSNLCARKHLIKLVKQYGGNIKKLREEEKDNVPHRKHLALFIKNDKELSQIIKSLKEA